MLTPHSGLVRAVGMLMAIGSSTACHATRPQAAVHGTGRPVELLGVPANHLVRAPSVAARSDTVFIAGNVLPIEGDSLLPRPLFLGRVLQLPTGELAPLSPLELPTGDFQFAYPRIGAARDAIHLVWAEFATRRPTSGAWLVGWAATLWHAALRNGTWSAPERIAEGVVLGWNEDMGAIAVNDDGTLHVAVGVSDSLPAVRHIRLDDRRRHTTTFGSGGWGPSAVASRGDTVVVALVDAQVRGFHVKLFRSYDDGERWERPTVASSREHGTVGSLMLTAIPKGTLLAIAEKPFDSMTLDTIRLVRSAGDESVAGAVVPPPYLSSLVLTATPCGSVVMLGGLLSMTPQIFDFRIPRDSLTASVMPLLTSTGLAAFPGVGATKRSTVAVFSYSESAERPVRSVAMPLNGCPPSGGRGPGDDSWSPSR